MEKRPEILITNKVNDEQFGQALEIYYNAFEQKIRPLFKPKEKAIRIYSHAIHPNRVYYALENRKAVGIIGLQYDDLDFLIYRFDFIKKQYSFFRGLYLYIILNITKMKLEEYTIRIDSIAVDDQCRGQGIGKILINKAIDIAKNRGFKEIILEVVNTNPRAKKLYEKMGFKEKKHKKFYFLTRSFGFSSFYVMSMKIQ
jgi:ribosomal protein S18 acetylase RimI-like enzyme